VKLDRSALEKLGFRDARVEKGEILTLKQHHASPISLLTSYPTLGYEFAVAEDEIIVAKRGGKQVRIFGRSFSGVFFMYTNKSNIYHAADEQIALCNSSIAAFVRTYSMFISKVCLLKAYFGDDHSFSRWKKCAREFAQFYAAVERNRDIDKSFWGEAKTELEDRFIHLRPPLIYYINAGRIAWPKEAGDAGG
jgi:hypothetical protein